MILGVRPSLYSCGARRVLSLKTADPDMTAMASAWAKGAFTIKNFAADHATSHKTKKRTVRRNKAFGFLLKGDERLPCTQNSMRGPYTRLPPDPLINFVP